MKKLILLACIGLAIAAGRAFALPVVHLHEEFSSGAVFDGDLTFTADYSNLVDVDGYLSGGSYGSDHINWIWDPNTNFASSFGANYGGNFLMDGSSGGGYTNFITVTWDFSGAPSLFLASPGGLLSPNGGNNVTYSDPLVSGQFSSVPEAGSTAILAGLGLLALIAGRRRLRA